MPENNWPAGAHAKHEKHPASRVWSDRTRREHHNARILAVHRYHTLQRVAVCLKITGQPAHMRSTKNIRHHACGPIGPGVSTTMRGFSRFTGTIRCSALRYA